MQVLDEPTIKSKIKSGETIYLQFSADWCGPCKSLTKYIETNQEKYPDISFYKVDVDSCTSDFLNSYKVSSIPKSVLLTNGNELGEFVGFNPTKFEEIIRLYENPEAPSK
tara:strand:+ start:1644 stop:1973 length:330 start_codon:yes stop_codon:yes gene_type:complete